MFARLIVCFALLLATPTHAAPNIVLLLADDAGYTDFGFQPHADPALAKLTPHLNTLAQQGITYTNAYVSGCVCSPSRAGLLTGRYQQKFGHGRNLPHDSTLGLPLTEKLIGDHLRPRGYHTALIGKWHLGSPDPYQPQHRGFDHTFTLLQGSRKYFPIQNIDPHERFYLNGQPTPEQGYVTDRIGDQACQYLRAQTPEKPFFLFVSFTAPHGPLEPKDDDLAQISKTGNPARTKYAALIKSLDDNCGKILATLKTLNLENNTLVIFSNDNGGQTLSSANNHPLRGRKGDLYEGGIRVPMLMRWPGHIPPGSQHHSPVISLDWLPTFIEATGGKIDPTAPLDGISLLPTFKDPASPLPLRSLYWRNLGPPGPIAIRDGPWKLINLRNRDTEKTGPELYNLDEDLSETHNLAQQNPAIVTTLQQKLKAWESTLHRPLW